MKMDSTSTSSSKVQSCNYCAEVVSGPTYQCIICDEFILHESCADFYTNSEFILENEGSMFYLEPNPNPHEYEFPEMHKCGSCEGYSLDCNNCLLQTHIKCGPVPTVWRYKKHEHPLSFVIMPFWCKYQYQCIACSKYGTYIGYKCYGCNIDIHVSCAIKESSEDYKKQGITPIVTGPWGVPHGYDQWDDGAHSGVRRMLIVYGKYIDFIQIDYIDRGKPVLSKKHGFIGGKHPEQVEVLLDYPMEYLTEVHGTYEDRVCSLTLRSNKKTYGPFGSATKGTYFSSLHGTDGGHYKIVGFYGWSGSYVFSIGFYLELVRSHKSVKSDKTSTTRC